MDVEKKSPPNSDLKLLVLLLGLLVVACHLTMALHGHGLYRDQHLGTALHYANTQIDLQHTIIVGFNANDTPTIQELPVWQMVVGAVFKLMGTHWWGWGNVISLCFFLPCLYPLFRIAQQFYGDRAGWWTLAFFLAQALVVRYAGEAGTDGLSLSLTIWFWFACVRLLARPVKWFLPAAALGTLVALSKLPFFMATGLAAFLLLLKTPKVRAREILTLAGIGLVAGVIFMFWTHYTDALQANAEFPFVDLRLGGSPTQGMTMFFWYFGDWHYRLSLLNWGRAAWRFASAVFGSFTLIALFGWAFVARRVHPAAKFMLAGACLTTLIFSHLVLHHYHYYLMFTPAVAMLCAAVLTPVETFLVDHGIRRVFLAITVGLVLLMAMVQGAMSIKIFSFDKYPARMADLIRSHTTPQDKLAIINGGWGGDELMRSNRRGLSIWNASIFADQASLARLKTLGFNKLIILSESPFQNAIQIVNPGQTDIPRLMAASYLTPEISAWPIVYETGDIIIKDIP